MWRVSPWRQSVDWCENLRIKELVDWTDDVHEYHKEISKDGESLASSIMDYPASTESISAWYVRRVQQIDERSGRCDYALQLAILATEKGVPNLETTIEDLTTFNDIVYKLLPLVQDANSNDAAESFSLSRYGQMTDEEILQILLSKVTPKSVVTRIMDLVLPFLNRLFRRYVIRDDANSPLSLLYSYIRQQCKEDFEICTCIIEGSKPTMSASERVITSNRDLAQVALDCLYDCEITSGSIKDACWKQYWRIYESLPDFEAMGLKGGDYDTLQDQINHLENHIVAGETFAYYGIPIDLRTLREASSSVLLQRRLLTQLTHCGYSDTATDFSNGDQAQSGLNSLNASRFENLDVWYALLDDIFEKLKGESKILKDIEQQEIYFQFLKGALSEGSKS
jgi:hypothetical protein